MEAGRGGCQVVMMTVTSNERGGAYRWADEVEWRGGCPALTPSVREKGGGQMSDSNEPLSRLN